MIERSISTAPSRAELTNCPIVLFDCDGVILDSNSIKTEGFRRAVEAHDETAVEAFVDFHRRNGGLSRYAKFEHFFRDLLGLSEYQAAMDEALERFANVTRESLLACPLVPGITGLLTDLNDAGVPCFVVSGSDQRELRGVLAERRLDRHFEDIFGSPATKPEHVRTILDGRPETPVAGGVLFGDALVDMETAEKFGLIPVFVSSRSQWEDGPALCTERGWPRIEDFTSLK